MKKEKNNRIAAKLVRGLYKEMHTLLTKHNAFIAGGAVLSVFTGKKINDYDIYFLSEEDALAFEKELKLIDKKASWVYVSGRDAIIRESRKNNIEIFRTDNSVTFFSHEQKYQIIKAFYLPMEDLFAKYDFTVCMGAYDVKNNEFSLHDNFLLDISEKRLRFNIGTEYPICSLLRVLKYQKKGYIINGLELIKLSLTINNLDLTNYAELKKQLQGIDTMFLKELTDTLSSEEYAAKKYDFNKFINMFDEYISNSESAFFRDHSDDPEE